MKTLNTKGLMRGRPRLDRLNNYEQNYIKMGECWIWTGPMADSGYGIASDGRNKTVIAHRAVYEKLVGPIPKGTQLDHTCRQRACINPAHLEPVTPSENCRRSWEARKGTITFRKEIIRAIQNGNKDFDSIAKVVGGERLRVKTYLWVLSKEGVIINRKRGSWEVISDKYN